MCALHLCTTSRYVLDEPNLVEYVSNRQVCVPAGEVGQEGVGEGASSRTPGSLNSFTHKHHTSGLEGDCSSSKVPEVGQTRLLASN